MTAFERWLLRESKGDQVELMALLMQNVATGSSESPVWDWLEETGHRTYTTETFILAAEQRLKAWKLETSGAVQ